MRTGLRIGLRTGLRTGSVRHMRVALARSICVGFLDFARRLNTVLARAPHVHHMCITCASRAHHMHITRARIPLYVRRYGSSTLVPATCVSKSPSLISVWEACQPWRPSLSFGLGGSASSWRDWQSTSST